MDKKVNGRKRNRPIKRCDYTRWSYAVVSVDTRRVVYRGRSLDAAAERMEPGTMWAKHRDEEEAVWIAQLKRDNYVRSRRRF